MNFQLEEILTVIDHVKSTDLALFEYRDRDVRIKIRGQQKIHKEKINGETATENDTDKTPEGDGMIQCSVQSAEKNAVSTASADLYTQESPMVGTFYAAPSEGAQPFVKTGDFVREGQTIGIIEAMKLMNEVSADCSGVVEAIMAENEQMVEYGQPLLRIRKEE